MKYMKRLISLLGAAATLGAWATAVENTNTVAVAILAYASMDNDDDLDAENIPDAPFVLFAEILGSKDTCTRHASKQAQIHNKDQLSDD